MSKSSAAPWNSILRQVDVELLANNRLLSPFCICIIDRRMPELETVSAIQKYRERCEDRVATFQTEQRTAVVVADGAGGTGSGDLAAESVIREIKANFQAVHSANDWADLLLQIDKRITDGETTAVVVDVRPYGIAGASVGDSRAWIINDGRVTDLTSNQIRKPLMGSGQCKAIGFTYPALDGLLLVATDGVFDYAKPEQITRVVSESNFFEIARKCIELVRLPSGEFWDDVGVVVCRNKPMRRNRVKYEI